MSAEVFLSLPFSHTSAAYKHPVAVLLSEVAKKVKLFEVRIVCTFLCKLSIFFYFFFRFCSFCMVLVCL